MESGKSRETRVLCIFLSAALLICNSYNCSICYWYREFFDQKNSHYWPLLVFNILSILLNISIFALLLCRASSMSSTFAFVTMPCNLILVFFIALMAERKQSLAIGYIVAVYPFLLLDTICDYI